MSPATAKTKTTTKKKAAPAKAKAASTEPKPTGRPRIDIDWNLVGQLCEVGASALGIAGMIGCDEGTLRSRSLQEFEKSFSEWRAEKMEAGNGRLHSKQFQLAMEGNPTMLVWLGKNRLGQSDKAEVKLTVDIPAIAAEIVRHVKRTEQIVGQPFTESALRQLVAEQAPEGVSEAVLEAEVLRVWEEKEL